ncbi:FecR domain-containing protein [candidate division KSB1 bacterium]|nr:FecR domain-containing protein [candidate division KSB1 bacterium]
MAFSLVFYEAVMKSEYKLLLTVLLLGTNVWAAGNCIGTLSFMIGTTGQVQILRQDNSEWMDAELYTSIFEKDKIRTGQEARCEIKLTDGGVIRIGEETEYEFIQATDKGKKSQVNGGRIWANLSKRKRKSEFEIKTPTAVCAVRGTIYRIDADSTTRCLVYDGAVDVGPTSFWEQTSEIQKPKSLKPVEIPGPYEIPPPYEVSLEDWIRIVKGYQVIVRADGKYAKSRFDKEQDASIDWVKWNLERDSHL